MSGDDNATEDWEGWDPLFGRWPKWSESYIYTQLLEGGVAYWTNLHFIYIRSDFDIAPNVSLRAEYQGLMAPRAYQGSPLGSTGTARGDMVIGKVTYKVNDYLSGNVTWEHFNPGDYYWEDADAANWLRFELMLKVE